MQSAPQQKRRPIRFVLRWTFRLLVLACVLAVVGMGYWLRDGLHNRFTVYPEQAKAMEALRAQFQPVSLDDGWNEYRGIVHSHSHLSHDSDVPFEEILQVLKDLNMDFILMSDHCDENKGDYSKQWRGIHEGKLFVPGFEMSNGFMPSFLPAETVLQKDKEPKALAQEIGDKGGLLFYVHCEEPRDWEMPQLNGMELYNIHADFKDLDMAALIPDILCNLGPHHEQLMRSMYKFRPEMFARWDELNRTRKITGFGGNDCHQNTGFRGIYEQREDGGDVLRIEDTSPDTLKEFKLNFLTRGLLRFFAGPLENGKKLFHVQLDPYMLMGKYVNTHVIARDLSEESIKEAFQKGRAYMGFTMLADCRGFVYFAQDGQGAKAVMGESMPLGPEVRLRAAAPLPCRFIVRKDGEVVHTQEGRDVEYQPLAPGNYRVEAELDVQGQWIPWIYANPIAIK